jgi:riboflavin transporter FmnP
METKGYFTPQRITRIALLAAISTLLFLIPGIPIVAFYKLDLSNIPVLLGGFSMGPLAGLIILGIKSAIGVTNSLTGGVGELADFLVGAALMLPAVIIYRRNKNRKTALAGMAVGTVAMIIAGVVLNAYVLIPAYAAAFHMPVEGILAMVTQMFPSLDTMGKILLCVTAPFNLLKGVVLSAVTFVLYRRLSPLLHGRVVR